MALRPLDPSDDDKLDRDRFYAEPAAEDGGDDEDYELEAVDQEILDHAKEAAQKVIKKAEAAIDVDEIYRELDHRDDFDGVMKEFRARFSLRSLLWVMTGVALLLGVGASGFFKTGTVFAVLIGGSVLGLGAAHAWLNYRENLRRDELIAKRAEQLRAARRVAGEPEEQEDDPEAPDPPPKGVFTSVFSGLKLKRRLSLGELMLAVALASIVVAVLTLVGSPARAAGALGAIAVLGFAIQAAEIDIPRALVLAWWLALVGYSLMTLVLAVLAAAGWVLGAG